MSQLIRSINLAATSLLASRDYTLIEVRQVYTTFRVLHMQADSGQSASDSGWPVTFSK